MGITRNFVTPLHEATKRDYLGRMNDNKANCMIEAKNYDYSYWDGDRRFGYGGYQYIAGRWKPVAESLISTYNLTDRSNVLDVGCGKGFLLYEMILLLPVLHICGFDVSAYGIQHAEPEISDSLFVHKAEDPYPFKDGEFDLVLSLGCLHNLRLFDVEQALNEINRVGKHAYVLVESYRNELEQFNLQCWALTAQSFFGVDEWIWLYRKFGYQGDYEFIFFS